MRSFRCPIAILAMCVVMLLPTAAIVHARPSAPAASASPVACGWNSYDFSALTSQNYNVTLPSSPEATYTYTYVTSLCRPLIPESTAEDPLGYVANCTSVGSGSSACFVELSQDDGLVFPTTLGIWDNLWSNWSYIDERNRGEGVQYTLVGGQCLTQGAPSGAMIVTQVQFVCDPSAQQQPPQLNVTGSESDPCLYQLRLPTSLACKDSPPPPPAVPAIPPIASCRWTAPSADGGFEYDFTSLTTTNWNWTYGSGPIGPNWDSTAWLRLCGGLVPQNDLTAQCVSNSGGKASACGASFVGVGVMASIYGEVDDSKPIEWSYINPNEPSEGVQYTLTGGLCFNETDYSTNVRLLCDPSVTAPTLEVDQLDVGGCVFNFTLATPLACNGNPPPPTPTSGCGFDGLDFGSLSGADLSARDGAQEFFLRVCGDLDATPHAPTTNCTAVTRDASVCMTVAGGAAFVLGEMSPSAPLSSLNWSYVEPSDPAAGVQYSLVGTSTCWEGAPWTAQVQFVCSATPLPFKVANTGSENGCNYQCVIPTPLACRH